MLQEVFVVAIKNMDALKAATSKRAWLIGIARNIRRAYLRREARRRTSPLPDEPAGSLPESEDARVEAMRTAIRKLPDGQREVIELRLGQELSYAEVAETLGIPIGTVRSRLHLAVGALRDWARAAMKDMPAENEGGVPEK
jgi:RNA polymerase sigma-70 factor (ECF subfamily)